MGCRFLSFSSGEADLDRGREFFLFEFLFLPLVLRVVQDPAAKCRAAAGTVTKLLLRRVGRKKCQVCWGCSERAPEAALT